MEKRAIFAVVLSLAVLFIYQIFFVKPPATTQQTPPQKENVASEKPAATIAPSAQGATIQQKPFLSQQVTEAEKDIRVNTPLYSAIFTTRGGALKSFRLKDYYETPGKRDKPVELVQLTGNMPRPLLVSYPESSIDVPPEGTFAADKNVLDIAKTNVSQQLTFSQTYQNAVKIEKIYTFYAGKYTFDLEVKVFNLSPNPINENIRLTWTQFVDPAAKTDSYSGHEGPISFIAKEPERQDIKKLDTEKMLGPNVSWGGFESKYFIASMISHYPSLTNITSSIDSNNIVSVTLKGPKNLIPPGQAASFMYTMYLGPKDYNMLKEQGVGMENAIDFGSWMKWLAMPLLIVLKFLYNFVHNYGIAIIFLTILIKFLFWPLGNKSYKSMKEMQKLQPKLVELREKFKDDKAKLGQETMALYKAHKVNPFGGCIPLLVQIPVFFGLYRALLYAIELRHSPFFGWIQDLSAKDPYYITPILMGATMFIQQRMSPPMSDPMQNKMMMLMPIVFTFMFLNFPSGLVIYWLFNNIISIGQQYYVNKKVS
jgi:YidC/Oxa1 family membrane protein insertase